MKTLQHIHTVNTKLQNKNQIIELKKKYTEMCTTEYSILYSIQEWIKIPKNMFDIFSLFSLFSFFMGI